MTDVLGEAGISIQGSRHYEVPGTTASSIAVNWGWTELVDAVAGVVDFVRVVGGNGRFKDLIGGYAMFRRVRFNSIGTENPCVCGLMLSPHVVEFTDGWARGG